MTLQPQFSGMGTVAGAEAPAQPALVLYKEGSLMVSTVFILVGHCLHCVREDRRGSHVPLDQMS